MLLVLPSNVKLGFEKKWLDWVDVPELKNVIRIQANATKKQIAEAKKRGVTIVTDPKDLPSDAGVYIVNYDLLKHYKEKFDSMDWDVQIADEAHRVKNPKALRSVALLGGLAPIDTPMGKLALAKLPLEEQDKLKSQYEAMMINIKELEEKMKSQGAKINGADDSEDSFEEDDEESGETDEDKYGKMLREMKANIPKVYVQPIPSKRHIFMTGTPIRNRADEIWPLVRILDPDGLAKDFEAYFGKPDEPGKKKKRGRRAKMDPALYEQFHDQLRMRVMVRRKAEDVLDLPPKTGQVIKLEPNAKALAEIQEDIDLAETYHDYLRMVSLVNNRLSYALSTLDREIDDVASDKNLDEKERTKMLKELNSRKRVATAEAKQKLEDIQADISVPFEKMTAVRHKTALAKLPQFCEYMLDKLDDIEPDKKILVFAHHKDVIEGIENAIREYNKKAKKNNKIKHVKIVGGMNDQAKFDAENAFQDDPKVRIIVGNIQAAGEGITLTAGSYVLFAEQDWTPGGMDQAEARAWRIGQNNHVFIDNVVFPGTLDDYMAQLIEEKRQIINQTLDRGKPAQSKEDVIKEAEEAQRKDVERFEQENRDTETRDKLYKKYDHVISSGRFATYFNTSLDEISSNNFGGSFSKPAVLDHLIKVNDQRYSRELEDTPAAIASAVSDEQLASYLDFKNNLHAVLHKIAWTDRDRDFGSSLANTEPDRLTGRQAAFALKKIHQYRDSLSEDALASVGFTGLKKKPAKQAIRVSDTDKPATAIQSGERIRAVDNAGNVVMGHVSASDAETVTIDGEKHQRKNLSEVKEYTSPIHSDPERKAKQLEAIQQGLASLAEADYDHVREKNDMGFSLTTHAAGHMYAKSDLASLPEADQVAAYKILQFHQGQVPEHILDAAGIVAKERKQKGKLRITESTGKLASATREPDDKLTPKEAKPIAYVKPFSEVRDVARAALIGHGSFMLGSGAKRVRIEIYPDSANKENLKARITATDTKFVPKEIELGSAEYIEKYHGKFETVLEDLYSAGLKSLEAIGARTKERSEAIAEKPARERKKKADGFRKFDIDDLLGEDWTKAEISKAFSQSLVASSLRLKRDRVGRSLGLGDLLKSHPAALLESWAEKMKKEGGEHPFTWCVEQVKDFTDNPEGFCANVYRAAFGLTPAESKKR